MRQKKQNIYINFFFSNVGKSLCKSNEKASFSQQWSDNFRFLKNLVQIKPYVYFSF